MHILPKIMNAVCGGISGYSVVIVVGMILTVGGSLRQSCGVDIGVVAVENGH